MYHRTILTDRRDDDSGAVGPLSVRLAERRRRQRRTLLWKVLTRAYDIPPGDVGLHLRQSTRPERGAVPNPLKLLLPRASDVSSSLWRATSMRTIADFNALPGKLVGAKDAGTFSNGLASTPDKP